MPPKGYVSINLPDDLYNAYVELKATAIGYTGVTELIRQVLRNYLVKREMAMRRAAAVGGTTDE